MILELILRQLHVVPLEVLFSFLFIETGSPWLAQVGLELAIPLPQAPEYRDCRHVSPHSVSKLFFSSQMFFALKLKPSCMAVLTLKEEQWEGRSSLSF
jgi:hypothetical protein